MPTYEYKCEACDHAFERFQSITAAPIKKCPECGKNKVRRLLGTGAGLIFKGNGFYITDYRDSSYKEAAKKDSGSSSSSSGSDTKSSSTSSSNSSGSSSASSSASSGSSSSGGSKGSGKSSK